MADRKLTHVLATDRPAGARFEALLACDGVGIELAILGVMRGRIHAVFGRRSVLQGCIGLVALALTRKSRAGQSTQSLFRIDRSKNANIVQYDAVLDSPTELNKDRPVIGYWINNAEDGRRMEFNALDKLAYGFKVEREKGTSSWILRLAASPKRPIRVVRWNGRWVPQMLIAGTSAVLDHLYVVTDEGGVIPTVRYVDAFGAEMATGKPVTERLTP